MLRWPPQKQIADELDRLQRKMTAILMRVPRHADEPIDFFVRRRGRLAASVCKRHGLWSLHWFDRATKWDDHLSRDRNSHSWPARLRSYRDREWFLQRRIALALEMVGLPLAWRAEPTPELRAMATECLAVVAEAVDTAEAEDSATPQNDEVAGQEATAEH